MANITAAEHPELVLEMTAMERTTPAHYDEWNVRHQQLLDNDKYLNEQFVNVFSNSAAAHNSIYRGKNLTNVYTVRRHIVGGANCTLISVLLPPRLCRTGICRRLLAE